MKNEKDDAAYFNKAWSEVPYSIIAMQTANTDKVDAVSGATYSSNGIMEAVRNALKKAVAKKDSTNSNTSNSNNNNRITATTIIIIHQKMIILQHHQHQLRKKTKFMRDQQCVSQMKMKNLMLTN